MTARPDLHRLSKPFPKKFVAKKEGADYVNHAIVQQRLLGTVGPFDMRVDQVIRGPIAEKTTGKGDKQRTWPAADNAVVGVVLTCVFTIDGRQVEVSEVGTPEGYYMAPHDGDRLKKAVSDALKRCAMRVGVGLDLWSKGSYVLPAMLARDLDPETGEAVDPEEAAPQPAHDAPDPDDVVDGEPSTETDGPADQEADRDTGPVTPAADPEEAASPPSPPSSAVPTSDDHRGLIVYYADVAEITEELLDVLAVHYDVDVDSLRDDEPGAWLTACVAKVDDEQAEKLAKTLSTAGGVKRTKRAAEAAKGARLKKRAYQHARPGDREQLSRMARDEGIQSEFYTMLADRFDGAKGVDVLTDDQVDALIEELSTADGLKALVEQYGKGDADG